MQLDRQQYVKQVIAGYCRIPGTLGRASKSDRHLAAELWERDIPLSVVSDALIVATARRTLRDPSRPPLPTIRSLNYFVPIIHELMQNPLSPDYIRHIQRKLKKYAVLP
jgi:hypothetical protein